MNLEKIYELQDGSIVTVNPVVSLPRIVVSTKFVGKGAIEITTVAQKWVSDLQG